ncbi:hypothetical protein J2S53_002735 [Actinopolyspora lacussalsi]|nr:hypothetical protein [Actinopolyspora lacussalsi]
MRYYWHGQLIRTELAITGHRGLPGDTERVVDTALRDEIARTPEVSG